MRSEKEMTSFRTKDRAHHRRTDDYLGFVLNKNHFISSGAVNSGPATTLRHHEGGRKRRQWGSGGKGRLQHKKHAFSIKGSILKLRISRVKTDICMFFVTPVQKELRVAEGRRK